MILHMCDNPPCCNPDHLYPGGAKQNSRDAYERGRAFDPPSRRKLTMEQAGEVRDRYAAGELGRDLACEYGVSAGSVSEIVNWKSYVV